jgi:hypothetical protein
LAWPQTIFERVQKEGNLQDVHCCQSGGHIGVARTYIAASRICLVDAFHGQEDLAVSVNHLLIVGLYLINVGYVAFALRTSDD